MDALMLRLPRSVHAFRPLSSCRTLTVTGDVLFFFQFSSSVGALLEICLFFVPKISGECNVFFVCWLCGCIVAKLCLEKKILHLSPYCCNFRDWETLLPKWLSKLCDVTHTCMWRACAVNCNFCLFCFLSWSLSRSHSTSSFSTVVWFTAVLSSLCYFGTGQCCQQHQWTKKKRLKKRTPPL